MNKFAISILTLGLALSAACSPDQKEHLSKEGNIDRYLPQDETGEEGAAAVSREVFDLLNLDYPGLENVKSALEERDTVSAAKNLLDYWRTRSGLYNPDVDLITTTCTASEKNIADQALEYRFYVRNFAEKTDAATGLDIYYSFGSAGKIDWEYVPEGVTSQEFRYQKHRHQWMEPQAKAYRTTGDEAYFKNWVEVYGSWMEAYPFPGAGTKYPPEGGAENDVDYQWKGLQVAERVLSQINILSYYIYSENFTPAWLTEVLNLFAGQVELMRNNYYQTSNILITQAQAVATAGILMPEFKNSGEWAAEGCAKLKENLDSQFLEDGVQYELDPSYHIAAIADFLEINDLVKLNGRTDLLGDDFLAKLRDAMTFVADITYPDYSLDNWNDTRSASYSRSVLTRNFTKYADAFPDEPYFKWMATGGAQGSNPGWFSKAYPDAGYYMLRNGWDTKSTMMVLKNNDNASNAWHCQPDNGTFGIWRNGRNFFPDAGCYSYNTDSDRAKYAATINHNTISMSSKDYASGYMRGELVKMETKDGTELLVTSHLIKEGVTHRRTVFFVDREFFVIVDDVFGGASEKANFNIHLLSTAANPTVFSEDERCLYTTFSDGNNMYVKTFVENEQDFAIVKKTSKFSSALGEETGDRVGYQFTNRKLADKSVRLVTVILPFSDAPESISVDAVFTDNEQSGVAALHPEGSAVRVTVGSKEYDLNYQLEQ